MKLAVSGAALLLVPCLLAQPSPQPVTLPVTLDHNRTIVDVHLTLPDGSDKRVRAWVDPGIPDLWISGDLAGKLGLKLLGDDPDSKSGRLAVPPRSLRIGGLTIDLGGIEQAHVAMQQESIAPGSSAAINLPASILRRYDVVFDYPNREMTIGEAGSVHFTGTAVEAGVSPNGLLHAAAGCGGRSFQIAIDPGSVFSLLSQREFDALSKAHPRWPRMAGSVGPANFWGTDDEATRRLLRVPALQVGQVTFPEVGFAGISRDISDFLDQRAGVALGGALGADALLNFKVGIDYSHRKVYFDRQSDYREPGIDVVGIVLRPGRDERYSVAGVADYDGKPSVARLKAGDILVSVDKVPAKGSTMGQIWSLLQGSPGDTKNLVVERDGAQITVPATVRRFLPLTASGARARTAGHR